jgi:2-C-methyl-D-erythritol 4-phosphate cytidylyltransferase
MTWAIVVAAGTGTRFGGRKQFLALKGRSVAGRSVEACRSVASGVVLVVPADADAASLPGDLGADVVVPGGATRSDSVRAGLAHVPEEATIIVVHDAARPLARAPLFERAVEAVRAGASGAICAVAVTDTIKVVRDGGGRDRTVVETLDRSSLVAVQTPQAFDAATLRRAHAACTDATDDAALVEALGATVVVVEGDRSNRKLTEPDDLAVLLESLGP